MPIGPLSRRIGVVALVAIVSASACRIGTDLPGEEQATLEQAEAEAILSTIVLVTLENTVFSTAQTAFTHSHGPLGALHSHPIQGPFIHDPDTGPGPLPSSHNLFNADFTYDLPCAGGGSFFLEAAAVGEGNPLIQLGFVDYQLGHELRDCVLEVESLGGERFILSTPPYVTGEANVRYDGSSLGEMSGILTGGLAWEGEAKAGECDLDLTFAATGPTVGEIVDIPVTGTFCDLEIDAVFSRS